MQLQVEKFRAGDIGRVCSWIKSERAMVQWAGPSFSWPMTQKQLREQLRAAKGKSATLFPFGLYRGYILIGYCELARYDRKSQSVHLSRVIISPKHRNKGFAQIMIARVLRFGFCELGLNRIALGVFDFNKSAIKCYKNMGFKLEGTLRQTSKVGDSFWNCHMMSILRKEWQANHSKTR
ncbi:MAG: GNAT family protein [Sedimentisphaerales bacterium]|jgi:RimJ/RimL family protein N-acetyltransferase